jgi:hypothetical protein
LTPEQRRAEIIKCLDLVEALEYAWEGWRELGVQIEAPFPDTAWRISSAYIELMEKRHGAGDFISWWHYENRDGKPRKIVIADGKTYTLKTRADFLDYLDAEYPIPQPEEGEA